MRAEMGKAFGVVVLLIGMLVMASVASSASEMCAGLPCHVDGAKLNVGGGKDCCDVCICALSFPPQCRCTDVSTSCYSGCKTCLCTRSIPPQCRCVDINSKCPKQCTTSGAGRI